MGDVAFLVARFELPPDGYESGRMWMRHHDPSESEWTDHAADAVAFTNAEAASEVAEQYEDDVEVVPCSNMMPFSLVFMSLGLRVLGDEAYGEAPRGRVYVVLDYDAGVDGAAFLKIGWAKDSPESRMKQLQTGNPRGLELLTSFPGSRRLEQRIHRALSLYRVQGEWFRHEPYVLGVVNGVRSFCAAKAELDAR